MMSAEVDPEGKQAGVSQRRGSSPRPTLLLALEGLLSLQLFHQGNGDLLLSRVRFGGGDGSRHAEIPGVVNGNSAPDGSDGQLVDPSQFVVLQSHGFGGLQEDVGFKVTSICGSETQPTRGVCRQ